MTAGSPPAFPNVSVEPVVSNTPNVASDAIRPGTVDDSIPAPINIDIDQLTLDDARWGDQDHQFNIRHKNKAIFLCNKARNSLIKRLQLQFRNFPDTVIAVSRWMEIHAPGDFATNVWASLRKEGFRNDEFTVASANSPYVALVTFTSEAARVKALGIRKFPHCRLRGEECKILGSIELEDLQVQRTEFLITGSATKHWEETQAALKFRWKQLFPGTKVECRKVFTTHKLPFLGEGVEERRETGAIDLTSIAPDNQVYDYTFEKAIDITITVGGVTTTRTLVVTPKNGVRKCRNCGDTTDSCRRIPDGCDKEVWACKLICYHCGGPRFAEGHSESDCALRKLNDGKMLAQERRNNVSIRQHDSYQKAVNMEKPGAKQNCESSAWRKEAQDKFHNTYTTLHKQSAEAAVERKKPYLNARQESEALHKAAGEEWRQKVNLLPEHQRSKATGSLTYSKQVRRTETNSAGTTHSNVITERFERPLQVLGTDGGARKAWGDVGQPSGDANSRPFLVNLAAPTPLQQMSMPGIKWKR
ncbi:MAG: hypothetical protein VX869_03310 [Chloroflexota bacterium]|nr:hypothetical protein [Chloroflexota bacterium]